MSVEGIKATDEHDCEIFLQYIYNSNRIARDDRITGSYWFCRVCEKEFPESS